MKSFKNFPPGWENIKVPTSSRRAMLAGIATYAPCLPKGIWGQRAVAALVRIAGPRALPGKSFEWQPPLPEPDWTQLVAVIKDAIGPYDAHSVYERRRGRPGLLMLFMRAGRPIGFLKARQGTGEAIARERLALEAIEGAAPRSFAAPRLLTAGEIGGDWTFVLTSAMPPGIHRMLPTGPPLEIHRDVAVALGGLPKPEGTPSHWEPFHGDFTPWNLRRFREGPPWLIDWEESGWGPPEADAAFYYASSHAIGRAVGPQPAVTDEVRAFWWDRVRARTAANLEAGRELRPLDYGLLEAFSPGR